MKQGPELSFDDDGRPVLITRAAQPYEEQHRERVRKYLKIMSWRIPALLGAAVAYGIWHNGLISLAILVASIPLPWIAVLIANDRPPRTGRGTAALSGHRAASRCSPPPSGPPSQAPRPALRRNRNRRNRSATFPDVRLLRLFSGDSQVDGR